MIRRTRRLAEPRAALRRRRWSGRATGKTTLPREIVALEAPRYLDLENPRALARLAEPMTALAPLRRTVVIGVRLGARGSPLIFHLDASA